MEQSSYGYEYREFPLQRGGIALHLDRIRSAGEKPRRNILLTHGVTYSSYEFDVDYRDYSLARFLAGEGYAVWRLDGCLARLPEGSARTVIPGASHMLMLEKPYYREFQRKIADFLTSE